MKTLIYGAGPLGSLYAHRLYQAGKDVTILARNERFDFIQKQGVWLVNEHNGQKEHSEVTENFLRWNGGLHDHLFRKI